MCAKGGEVKVSGLVQKVRRGRKVAARVHAW